MNVDERLLQSYGQLLKLKKLKRTGWLKSGVSAECCESVADHSFAAAWLGFFTALEFYPELNAEKVLLLALVHDFGEAVTGDVLPWDKLKDPDFDAKERLGALQTAAGLKALPRLSALYDEYYANKTAEARFVRQIDKLEMLLQAKNYEDETGLDLGAFFDNHPPTEFDEKLRGMR